MRQFRELTLAVPRKNGKSPLAAMLGLYHLFADNENYPEVVCAAGSAKQAKEVYDYARFFIQGCPALARRCVIKADEIVRNDGGKMRLLAADGKLQHGQNLSAVISDELHIWPDEVLYEALRTGVAGRRQPMRINISTAGYDLESKWGEIYQHAKRVMEARKAGHEIDPYLWAAIYEASAADDWRSEATWRKANPNYEISVYRSYFDELMAKAECSNSELNSFLRFNLNVWTNSAVQWLNMDYWDARYLPPDQWPDLKGRKCYVGVDLANTLDLAAMSLAFPIDGKIYLKSYAWTCSDAVADRERRNKMKFDKWAAQGHLEIHKGPQIDIRLILAKLDELLKSHEICEIGIDRWGAALFIQECQHRGLTVVGFGQGFAGISSPTKGFESAVLGADVVHDGHPVLRWCVSNVTISTDPAGNIKPDKNKSTEKIDLAVSSIMAVARAQLGQSGGASVYESRGLAVL
jgi:phage terminase large subunit-like protein